MKRNLFSPLFCDLYHLTMAQAMFDQGTHNKIETYEMFIRKNPFQGAYLLTAGLAEVLEWLNDWHYSADDINFLRSLGFKEKFSHVSTGGGASLEMIENNGSLPGIDIIQDK